MTDPTRKSPRDERQIVHFSACTATFEHPCHGPYARALTCNREPRTANWLATSSLMLCLRSGLGAERRTTRR